MAVLLTLAIALCACAFTTALAAANQLQNLSSDLDLVCKEPFPSFLSVFLRGNLTDMCLRGRALIGAVESRQSATAPLLIELTQEGLFVANTTCTRGLELYFQYQQSSKDKQLQLQNEWSSVRARAVSVLTEKDAKSCSDYATSVSLVTKMYVSTMLVPRDFAWSICVQISNAYAGAVKLFEYWQNQTALHCPSSPLCPYDKKELQNATDEVNKLREPSRFANDTIPLLDTILTTSQAMTQILFYWTNSARFVCAAVEEFANNFIAASDLSQPITLGYLLAANTSVPQFATDLKTLESRSCLMTGCTSAVSK